MKDKKHWYDGRFYDKLIAPNQDKIFSQIKDIIHPQCNVVDVGCGTGRLAYKLSDHCNEIIGVDLSSKNISVALEKKSINHGNINFIHGDIKVISKKLSARVDYSILTYVIHEMPEEERIYLLKDLKSISDKIIVGDYLVPTPKSFWGSINIIVEYLAGSDHFNNFKNYVKNGGINYLAKEANLKIIREVKNKPQTAHLVVLE